MTEECPYLSYRTEGDDLSFDVARAFCTVTGSFVQPMRADVCNKRYGLDPKIDCEFYIAAEETAPDPPEESGSDADGSSANGPDANDSMADGSDASDADESDAGDSNATDLASDDDR